MPKYKLAQPKLLKKETSEISLKLTNKNLTKTQPLGLNQEKCHGKKSS